MTPDRLHRSVLAELHRYPGATALEVATRLGLRLSRTRDVLDQLHCDRAVRERDGEWYPRRTT